MFKDLIDLKEQFNADEVCVKFSGTVKGKKSLISITISDIDDNEAECEEGE